MAPRRNVQFPHRGSNAQDTRPTLSEQGVANASQSVSPVISSPKIDSLVEVGIFLSQNHISKAHDG